MSDPKAAVLILIEKARDTAKSEDALRWSQAACNAANALCALETARKVAK